MARKRQSIKSTDRKTPVDAETPNNLTDMSIATWGDPSQWDDEQTIPADALIARPDGSLEHARFRLSKTALEMPDDVTEQEYEEIGRILLRLEGSIQWLLGDWLKEGDNRQWGTTYQDVAAEFGREVTTMRDYASVAKSVEVSRRLDTLTWSHHQVVRALEPDEQTKMLQAADESGMSVKVFRQYVKEQYATKPTKDTPHKFSQRINDPLKKIDRVNRMKRESVQEAIQAIDAMQQVIDNERKVLLQRLKEIDANNTK